MERIIKTIDTISITVGKVAAWFSLLLVLVVFSDVVMRYLLNTSFVFMQELEWHLFAASFLFGASYTLFRDGHVRVDILYQKMSEKEKAWTNLLGTIFFLLPGCILVVITSFPWIRASIEVWEGSPDPGGIPMRFILKACLPLGFIFLLLQGVAMALRNLMVIINAASTKKQ